MEAVKFKGETYKPELLDSIEQRSRYTKKGLLICSVAAAALSIFPATKIGATLTSRFIGLMTAINNVIHGKKNSWSKVALRVLAIVPVIIGTVGFLFSKTSLMTLALALDIGLRLGQMAVNISERDWASSKENGVYLLISAVALAAIIAASWEIMVIAAAGACLAMAVNTTVLWFRGEDLTTAICHTILSSIALLSLGKLVTGPHRVGNN